MNISRKTVVAVLAATSLALGAGVANAGGPHKGGWGGYCGGGYYSSARNWHSGNGGWGGYCGGGYYGKADGKWSEKDFKERIAERQERLKKALQIAPNQEAAWKTFTDQMTTLAQERAKNFDPDQFLGLTAPERMEKQLERLRQAQDAMSKRLEVVKTFYASLTAEQKKKFDDWHSPKRRR